MKVCMEDDILIVYYFEQKIEMKDEDWLEEHLRKIFLKLKRKYNMNFEGYYQIGVYTDPFYGSIFEIEKEEFDYFFDQAIDMHIKVNKIDEFLYHVENKPPFKGILYEKDGNLYFSLKENLDFVTFGTFLEKANIIYDEEVLEIKDRGTIVR